MADEKKVERLPLVELVAVERGFYKGAMVEPGKSFMYDPNPRKPGNTVKPPKWAKPKEEAKKALSEQAAKVKAFDTKPKEAQVAAREKGAALTGAAPLA